MGYTNELLTSKNVIIPIFYYLKLKENEKVTKEERNDLRKFLTISLIKSVVGSSSDTILNNLISIIKRMYYNKGKFDYDYITKEKISNKLGNAYKLSRDFIDNILDEYKYGEERTANLLLLLYSNLKYGEKVFQIDHLHATNLFNKKNYNKNISDENYKDWRSKKDLIPNLQMLERDENTIEKSGKSIKDWMKSSGKNISDIKFLDKKMKDKLDLKYCEEFWENRRENIKKELIKILNITK